MSLTRRESLYFTGNHLLRMNSNRNGTSSQKRGTSGSQNIACVQRLVLQQGYNVKEIKDLDAQRG